MRTSAIKIDITVLEADSFHKQGSESTATFSRCRRLRDLSPKPFAETYREKKRKKKRENERQNKQSPRAEA